MINDSLTEKIYFRFPDIDKSQSIKLWLSLTSTGRNHQSAVLLLEHLKGIDFEQLQKELFNYNLTEIKNNKNLLPYIGVWWHYHFFGSQLTPIAKRLSSTTEYNYLGVISENCLDNGSRSFFEDFSFGNYLLIPDEKNLKFLEFLDAIYFGETFFTKTELPRNIIRIGQPHGLDIPMYHACVKYGGGRIFDYILCPMHETKKSTDRYFNIFPQPLIEHNSNSVVQIPAGYPKLDHFFQVSRSRPVIKKIIYHISLWGIESEAARNQLSDTLGILLNHFPDREILFRHDQTEFDHPELNRALQKWKQHPGLTISRAPSYVDDYADAELLITHRPLTGHLFAYATGRPIITYQPGTKSDNIDEIEITDLGYLVRSENHLINQIEQVLSDPEKDKKRIQSHMNGIICHPGHTIDYFMEHLDVILARNHLSEWTCYTLYDESDSRTIGEQVDQGLDNSLNLGINGAYMGANIAQAAVCYFPENLRYRLIEAEIYSRFPDPFELPVHFMYWYLGLSHLAEGLKLYPEQPKNVIEDVNQWIINKGLFMAFSIKCHLLKEQQSYGEDIDDIIKLFTMQDVDGQFLKQITPIDFTV